MPSAKRPDARGPRCARQARQRLWSGNDLVLALLITATFALDKHNLEHQYHGKSVVMLLGPAAAKRQPSGAPAMRSVAGGAAAQRLKNFFEMGQNVV